MIVGRSLELEQLEKAIRTAVEGPAGLLIVEGEAGIGKSRLIAEMVSWATTLGYQVALGQAEELERHRPFGAIAECLGIQRTAQHPGRAQIAELLWGATPGLAGLGGVLAQAPGMDFRIADAMVTLVEEECRTRPALLVVEDLQWVDPSTVQVLHRLARSIDNLSGMVAFSCRPLPRPREVEHLIEVFRQSGALHLHLHALDDQAVAELARAILNADPGPTLLEQLGGGRGNPFLVIELLAALEQQGAIERTSKEQADIRHAALPPSLRLTILHRLSFLTPESVDVLRVASVLGLRFAVGDLSLIMERSATALLGALQESVRAGVLDEDGARLRFRHDLIRKALYDDIPQSVRLALHMEAARALASRGGPLDGLAEHLLLGARHGDMQAVEWLVKAGRDAAPRAPSVAVELLERALELGEPSDPGRDGVLADLAMALVWSGRSDEAEAVCRQTLLDVRDATVETTLRLCLTQTLLVCGHNEQALEEIEHGISSPTISEAGAARFRAWAATIRMAIGDLAGAGQNAEVARTAGEALGDNLTRSVALGVLAGVRRFQGRFAEGLSLVEDAIRLADRTPGHEGHRFPLNAFRAMLLLDLDRPGEAQAAIQEGRRLNEGVPPALVAYHWLSALGHFYSGAWDNAMAECQASLELGRETGMRQGLLFAYALTSIVALHRNDLKAAGEALANAEREFEGAGPQIGIDWMMRARSQLLEARGQPEAALQVLHNAWAMCSAAGLASEYPVLGPDTVAMALRLDEHHLALEVTRALTELVMGSEVPAIRGAALWCEGIFTRNAGLLVKAVEVYRGSRRPLERALVSEAAASALAQAGSSTTARALFEEALGLFEELGAARDVVRTESAMRAFGFRRGRSGQRRRPKTGWGSLTESELKVARLVAQGLSNPQIAEQLFVSPRTVQTHVSNVLAKLGLRSRVAIAAEAVQAQLSA